MSVSRKPTRRKPPPDLQTVDIVDQQGSTAEDFAEPRNIPDPDLLPPQTHLQLFWKFHIERFDPGLYLSTNPTLRHVRCRPSPGYFVRIHKDLRLEVGQSVKDLNDNFYMVFEDSSTGEPIISVTQTKQGLEYEILVRRCVRDGILQSCEDQLAPSVSVDAMKLSQASSDSKNSTETKSPFSRNPKNIDESDKMKVPPSRYHLAVRRPIPASFLPKALYSNIELLSYEIRVAAEKYTIGHIPQVRHRHFQLLSEDRKIPKLIRKRHIYLHKEFSGTKTQYEDIDLSLVAALLRPCESRPKKRMLRSLHTLSGQYSSKYGSWRPQSEVFNLDMKELVGAFSKKNKTDDLQAVLPEIKPYVHIGDGLYFDTAPVDDEPNHIHKYGWLTIYDLNIMKLEGVFDLTVALAVATSYRAWFNDNEVRRGLYERSTIDSADQNSLC